MDTWEERYLKLVAEHDKVLKEYDALRKRTATPEKRLQGCENAVQAWSQRAASLKAEIAKLYETSFALKVEGFFKTMWAWAKSGFKLASKDLGEKRMAICQTCPHLDNDRCTLCGCFMKAKSKVARAQCPIGRWKSEEEENK